MFVSAANMQDMRRHLVHVLPNASVVKNPVNLTDISPVSWPARDEPLCLASVGSLITIYKAQDLLMEVLSTESWRSRAWKLRLYGSGPDQNYLLALREHLGLQDRVELMGHVSDIRGLWAQNHLLVMPSFVEGTPISMVEAMLCARPVLVTDVAGCPEWVRDGVDGFVAPGPTRGSVSNTLERAWQSRADWKRMGAQAHERAVQLYDPQAGRTLLNLLRQTAKST